MNQVGGPIVIEHASTDLLTTYVKKFTLIKWVYGDLDSLGLTLIGILGAFNPAKLFVTAWPVY